jgi:hypothetical protein
MIDCLSPRSAHVYSEVVTVGLVNTLNLRAHIGYGSHQGDELFFAGVKPASNVADRNDEGVPRRDGMLVPDGSNEVVTVEPRIGRSCAERTVRH